MSAYDSLQAQAAQLTKNVEELEKKLLDARDIIENSPGAEGMRRLVDHLRELQQQQKTLETLGTAPLVIQSPINGVVAEIFHRPGENLLPGDPILSISSKNSERIVGYLKAPCTLQPKAGMTVQMRTRSQPRIEAESKISGVGAGFEVITNVVLIHPNMPAELGVPVAVAIPPSLRNQLRPGELVDILITER